MDDPLEVEDEPPVCPTSLESDKTLEVLQQLTLLLKRQRNDGSCRKSHMYAQRKIMELRKQKVINHYFKKQVLDCAVRC